MLGCSDKPKVTVVTAFHNRAKQLKRTVDSLINQSYENIEIVIVNDASTDDTSELLNSYGNVTNVRVITNENNLGFTRSMIKAVAEATGDLIAVQGAGDVSRPDRIARQVQYLNQFSGIGVVGCWYNNVVEDTGLVRERRPEAERASFESLILENVFSHGEVMFRRADYARVGGYRPEFKFCQDLDLWLRLIRVTKFGTVPEVLYDRYVLSDGVSYEPAKAVRQIRYGIATRRMAQASPTVEAKLLKLLNDEGINAVVETKSDEFQLAFQSYCLRQIAWGFDIGDQDIDEYLISPVRKLKIRLARSVLGSRGVPILRKVALRRLGVKKL